MSRTTPLYELQAADADITARREQLDLIEERLADDEAVVMARQRLAEARQRETDVERQQRVLEAMVEDHRARIGSEEQKLYGGTVRNPKELVALQEETDHLKAQQRRDEDRLLDLMADVEALQRSIATLSQELEWQERDWQAERARLLEDQERLMAELAALERKRQGLIPRVQLGDLKTYERLLAVKQGRAVVRAERGMCQGCRITLPISLLQRVRLGEELIQCSSCERILHLD